MKKINNNPNIPPTIIGAIDVAILTFLLGILSDVINKYFSKPIDLGIKLKPVNNDSDSITVKYNPENLENAEVSQISLKVSGKIHKLYKLIKFFFRSIRIKIYWHPSWLSVTLRENRANNLLVPIPTPGTISFDVLRFFSESDDDIDFSASLYVTANSPEKKHGKIAAKVEINSNSKFLCFCFNGILNSLINLKIEPCRIFIEEEGS